MAMRGKRAMALAATISMIAVRTRPNSAVTCRAVDPYSPLVPQSGSGLPLATTPTNPGQAGSQTHAHRNPRINAGTRAPAQAGPLLLALRTSLAHPFLGSRHNGAIQKLDRSVLIHLLRYRRSSLTQLSR